MLIFQRTHSMISKWIFCSYIEKFWYEDVFTFELGSQQANIAGWEHSLPCSTLPFRHLDSKYSIVYNSAEKNTRIEGKICPFRKTRDEIENFLSLCNIFYSLKHHLMQIVWDCLCHKARVGKGNDSIIRREAPGCK